ncbi:gliding motility lipoprotein GldB [Leeuwenhoekiella sp. NPDC079379]|uniref:gliding motility lipoprotein GldB n=1 Tax=Leeuwenhoekiella sp. NPDC079379 TaxID=3364122 RepID=UPI0037C8076C
MVKLLNFKKFIGAKRAILGRFSIFLGLLLFLITACKKDAKLPDEISEIAIDIHIDRFDAKFARVDSAGLKNLISEYPYLFPEEYPDSFWVAKINDTIQLELNTEVAEAFPHLDIVELELENVFKHIKFYYPKFTAPEVVTITSDVSYKMPVILTDSLLLIGLDNYLGPEHPFYNGIQRFYTQNFKKEQIDVNVADAFVSKLIKHKGNRRFLDEMIYHGKRLYMMQKLLTLKPQYEIIGYTADQYNWAEANEVDIWKYFIENQLLFDTDSKLLSRFVNPAPFSKFYLDFDNDSPPRLGRYIGWRIVNRYMERNAIPLQMLPEKSTDEIFEKTNYKPRN